MRADQARKIPITTFLERAGHKPAKSLKSGRELWYASPIRAGDSSPSFKVDTVLNLWFDHGVARGGNVIDLVIEMRRVTVKEALAILASGFSGTVPAARPLPKSVAGEKEKHSGSGGHLQVVSADPISHPALVRYLEERSITPAVARRYLKEVWFTSPRSPKRYFGLGFKCGDGFDVRSSLFKGFVGAEKTVTVIGPATAKTAMVFEGFMDFLSLLTLRGTTEATNTLVIILHSAALRRRAADIIKERGIETLMLYLDHDDAGRASTDFFRRETACNSLIDASEMYKDYKDLNAWLMATAKG
jgi:Toprim-like